MALETLDAGQLPLQPRGPVSKRDPAARTGGGIDWAAARKRAALRGHRTTIGELPVRSDEIRLIVAPRDTVLIWLPSILAIAVGFVVLVWAADRFVLGSAATAYNFGVSPLLIGLTVVGFGTSAPEFLVSGFAAATEHTELSVGNAIGSNITNVALVLGVSALVAPMNVAGTALKRELPILLSCMALATVLILDLDLGRIDGAVLMLALLGLMGWVVWLGLRKGDPGEGDEEIPTDISNGKAIVWIVVGILLLLASSWILVWGAKNLAHLAGVNDLVIGVSVVALGTSLPELAASVMAARRGEHELAVGNVIGSNMFNTLGVLALPGLIQPGAVNPLVLQFHIPAMFAVTFLFWLMARFAFKKSHVSRVEGAMLVLAFALYMGGVFATLRSS